MQSNSWIIKDWLDLTHFVFSNSIQNKQCFAILQLGVFVLVKGTLIVNSLASLQWISCCCSINFDWIHKIAWICMPLTFVSQTVKPCYLELNRSIYRKAIQISKVCRIIITERHTSWDFEHIYFNILYTGLFSPFNTCKWFCPVLNLPRHDCVLKR